MNVLLRPRFQVWTVVVYTLCPFQTFFLIFFCKYEVANPQRRFLFLIPPLPFLDKGFYCFAFAIEFETCAKVKLCPLKIIISRILIKRDTKLVPKLVCKEQTIKPLSKVYNQSKNSKGGIRNNKKRCGVLATSYLQIINKNVYIVKRLYYSRYYCQTSLVDECTSCIQKVHSSIYKVHSSTGGVRLGFCICMTSKCLRNIRGSKSHFSLTVGKYLFEVSKITLEHCSNVILLTLNKYLPIGLIILHYFTKDRGWG